MEERYAMYSTQTCARLLLVLSKICGLQSVPQTREFLISHVPIAESTISIGELYQNEALAILYHFEMGVIRCHNLSNFCSCSIVIYSKCYKMVETWLITLLPSRIIIDPRVLQFRIQSGVYIKYHKNHEEHLFYNFIGTFVGQSRGNH